MKRRFITVKEAAKYLALHPVTVRRLIDQAKIPASKIGRSVRVDKKILDEQLEKKRSV